MAMSNSKWPTNFNTYTQYQASSQPNKKEREKEKAQCQHRCWKQGQQGRRKYNSCKVNTGVGALVANQNQKPQTPK
jgi:hypothetical protein